MGNDINVLIENSQTIIGVRVAEFSTPWMELYLPRVRDHDEGLELFSVDFKGLWSRDRFSYLTPEAIPVYEGVFSRGDEGMKLDSFFKGAVSVTNLYSESTAQRAGELMSRQAELMMEKHAYPAVDEKFLKSYVDILIAILCNEEMSTWRDMLSYNAGVWWIMGLTAGLDEGRKRSFSKTVYEIVLSRAKLGTSEEY